MNSHFRPSTPDDAEAISLLMQKVFRISRDNSGLSVKQMHWKYWRPIPEWEGSRSFVMEWGRVVRAHGAVVPLTCRWGDEQLKLIHLIDWAARPDFAGAGIALMRHLGQMVDGVFAAGGSSTTEQILPAYGFKEIGIATRSVLPLSIRPRLASGLLTSWRPMARLARDLTLILSRPVSIPPRGWSARRLYPEDLHTDLFPTPEPKGQTAVFTRTISAIADLLKCPAVSAELYLVERDSVSCGYFLLTFAGRQGRIADAWIQSENVDDWYGLFGLAIQKAKAHRDIAELVGVSSVGTELQSLRRTGFLDSGRINLRIWTRRAKFPEGVRYQMLDGDAAYLPVSD